ncbi:membrane protein [Virgisporangium aliadipatigenens]|uniref:Membrane protein n=1 Tax=Virgisporangium aliadipatigenens TaxID=741659 RepID=A0A8J3YUV1_9ACTN|nr:ABC transporter permease [Virgisporangium aliadipatigenens]GIJ50255.1 membrane protein [Virgisporangium aliadipatigenens]
MRRWFTELSLGVRLSVAGGRSSVARLAMISVGVGLGVAMLLFAATVPAVVSARDARIGARAVDRSLDLPRGEDTVLLMDVKSEFRGRQIDGYLVQAEGARSPLPPGVTRRLAPGEMVASPAMKRLLDSEEGALLRGRWGERVVGTIGAAGLGGPGELYFYQGSDRLTEESGYRVRAFGDAEVAQGVPPVLLLLGVVGLVVLLLPVLIFVTTAVRFGSESRDRQLAALRLVGSDAVMTRRIAAGETLVGAVLGLLTGGLFFLGLGALAGRAVPERFSFYPADFRPVPLLALLVIVLVPVSAVLVTQSALRRVVVEPLGVVRRSGDRRRRLWWRLILPVAGLALLYPLHEGLDQRAEGFEYQVMAGVALLLVGVALLLPWLVEATVHRLGGGGVAWELAVRRLQLDSGTAVRAVSGIAVSVAGVIALQGLLVAVQAQYTRETGHVTDRYQAVAALRLADLDPAGPAMARLKSTPGVEAVGTAAWLRAVDPQGGSMTLRVGECGVLRQFGKVAECADGDVFVVTGQYAPAVAAGTTFGLAESFYEEPTQEWTLPGGVRPVPPVDDMLQAGGIILATPGAVRGVSTPLPADVFVALDPGDTDAMERLRNVVAAVDPSAYVRPVELRTVEAVLVTMRQGLLVGATALLLLIGASMLVNVVEQLRERRRLLAVLVAFGTRRGTLTGSVLYQVAIPVLLGLVLAVATGTGLGAVLQSAANAPVRFDWSGIGATSGAAALVVLLTTVATMPLLWRLTKPGGLRSE